jgi:putative ABC transport system permease protein
MTTRHLYRRPVRTSLTALGVAVGVIAIVAFTTIVRGWWRAANEVIHIDGADLIVFQANVAADLLSVLDEEKAQASLTAVPGVQRAVGSLWHLVRSEGHPFLLALGLRLNVPDYGDADLLRGRRPEVDDEVLLGSIAARMLDKDVGDRISIQAEPHRVVGVFQTKVVFLNGGIVLPLRRLQQLAGKQGQVTAFQVYVDPGADPETVARQIEQQCPELVAISGASEYSKVDQGLIMARGMVWAISLIAIVVGSIIVGNTMWTSVLERTREIGVLRAVGWSRRRIVFMIVTEAVGVGLVAVVVGCPLGVGLAKITTLLPVAEQFIEPALDLGAFLLALGVAVGLSVLGALIPSWRAARISPAEALRYE